MQTRIFSLQNFIESGVLSATDECLIEEAAGIIALGGLVAFPTETVYGLGGNALMKEAARKIYLAKGRPSDNPLIVHIESIGDLEKTARNVPEEAYVLAERFWPGPLSMVLWKNQAIPPETTGGLDTVALRCPSHPAARKLIAFAGVPIAAPSANTSGRPSTTSAAHAFEDLYGRVDGILDAGSSGIGLESTIIDLSESEPVLLRPGAVTIAMLSEALGREVLPDRAVTGPIEESDTPPKAPGMKYRHYAPRAPLILVSPGEMPMSEKISEILDQKRNEYRHIAVLCSEECAAGLSDDFPEAAKGVSFFVAGRRDGSDGMKSIASALFECMRQIDRTDADLIIAEGYPEEGMGLAVMNRLKKASGWNIL